jgi:hypothetical protein
MTLRTFGIFNTDGAGNFTITFPDIGKSFNGTFDFLVPPVSASRVTIGYDSLNTLSGSYEMDNTESTVGQYNIIVRLLRGTVQRLGIAGYLDSTLDTTFQVSGSGTWS